MHVLQLSENYQHALEIASLSKTDDVKCLWIIYKVSTKQNYPRQSRRLQELEASGGCTCTFKNFKIRFSFLR